MLYSIDRQSLANCREGAFALRENGGLSLFRSMKARKARHIFVSSTAPRDQSSTGRKLLSRPDRALPRLTSWFDFELTVRQI